MQVLRAAAAERRVDAPGVVRQILFPRFGAEPFSGIGALRALHLLRLDAGASIPALRLANLSVLRLCWSVPTVSGWLLRQDCGAGVELPVWTAPVPVCGVELWVQSRRSNGPARSHLQTLSLADDGHLARPGDPAWDAPLSVDWCSAGAAERSAEWCWWQQLWGEMHLGEIALSAGDGLLLAGGSGPRLGTNSVGLRVYERIDG